MQEKGSTKENSFSIYLFCFLLYLNSLFFLIFFLLLFFISLLASVLDSILVYFMKYEYTMKHEI